MGKSSSTFKKASEQLMERFPAIGLLAGSFGKKAGPEEALLPIDLGKAELLYIYGLSTLAFSSVKGWLESHPERRLVFLEDEPDAIGAFLHRPKAFDLLIHPQIHLELFSKTPAKLQQLAEQFPIRRIEMAALPSKRGVKSLRLQLLRKTALTHALQVDRLHGYQLFRNFIENSREIPRSFYANRLKGAFQNIPAVVCGAGPSLQKTIEPLRTLENRALLIAGGSTIAALSSQGVLPHFGMAIDPNLEEYRRLKNGFAFEMPLLYSTRVHPSIFQTCNGPFGYLRSGIGGAPELWLEEELGLLEPLMGDHLSEESISVTAICIAWAQFLGCNPILLNGIDMAYTGNRRYASGVMDEEEIAFQTLDREKSAPDRIVRKKDRVGQWVYTAVRWVMESAGISHFAKKHPETRFFNTTEGGIGFKGIEYVPLEEAITPFSTQPLREKIYRAIDQAKMPNEAKQIVSERICELKASLERLVGHLEILAGEKKGSAPLAEMELKEEIAFLFLFYDVYQILKPSPSFWKQWLALARKYF